MKKFSIIPIFTLVMSFFLIGCNNSHTDTRIKIGVILPLTGELASYGNPMKEGILMAYSELDSNKYKLIFIDSQGESKTAVNSLQKLISIDGVKYVIGDVSSSTTLSMVKVAEANNVFMLSPGASSPKLRNVSKMFARNYPSSVEESINSARFIFSKFRKDSIAVIYVNDEYGIGLASVFKDELDTLGGIISLYEPYQEGQSDFRTLIEKVKKDKPRVLYLAGNQKEMGKFMRQFHESNIMGCQVVSNISFLEKDCIQIAGSAANGTIVPLPYYNPQDSTYRGAYNFGQLFFRKFGKFPTVAEAVGYDAVKLMVKAIEESHNQPLIAASYIRNLKNYDGALGRLSFTNGEVNTPIVFKEIINGKPVDFKY